MVELPLHQLNGEMLPTVAAAPEPNQFGNRLRRHRLAAGLTLQQLASKAGFGKGYLSHIENGKKVPPIATLSRLADVLGQVDSENVNLHDGPPYERLNVSGHLTASSNRGAERGCYVST